MAHFESVQKNEKTNRSVARLLLDVGAVQFNFKNGFEFVSGLQSPVYIDSRLLFNNHESRNKIQSLLARFIDSHHDIHPQVIAGAAIGGIAPALLLAEKLKKSFVYVRKGEKEHGRKRRVEGGEVSKKSVLLVEDLVTTGLTSLAAIAALRAAGANVGACLTITSYGFR